MENSIPSFNGKWNNGNRSESFGICAGFELHGPDVLVKTKVYRGSSDHENVGKLALNFKIDSI